MCRSLLKTFTVPFQGSLHRTEIPKGHMVWPWVRQMSEPAMLELHGKCRQAAAKLSRQVSRSLDSSYSVLWMAKCPDFKVSFLLPWDSLPSYPRHGHYPREGVYKMTPNAWGQTQLWYLSSCVDLGELFHLRVP